MFRTLVVCTLVALAACARDRNQGAAAASARIDTVGGVAVVTNPGSEPGSDPVDARPVVTIGVIEDPPEYAFGAISSVAVDPSGRIYVSDHMADEVRVYGRAGEFIETIGRGGDGPGEFRAPTGLAFDPAGRLVVRDETRVQRFAPPSPGAVASRYSGSHPGPAYAFSLMPTRLDSAGRLYYPRRSGRIPDQRYFFLVFDSTGSAIDTLALPPWVAVPGETAILRTGASGGRMIPGLSRAPFSPLPSWDVTSRGHLIVAEGSAYELAELTSSGDTVRRIRRLVEPRAVPSREYDDSLRAVRRRVAEAPAPVERLEGVPDEVRRGRLSRTLPQVLSLHVGIDGRLWVERWPPQGASGSTYDRFSAGGVYERTVSIPDRLLRLPVPVFTERRIYGVIVDPATDVQRVIVYELDG